MRSPNGVPVYVIRRNDDHRKMYLAALKNAEEVEGIPMLVVIPEYIFAMKLQAHRDKDEIDMKFLIDEEIIDFAKTRRLLTKYLGSYAAEDFDRLVEEVEWLKTRK